jgi:hypothetical protein
MTQAKDLVREALERLSDEEAEEILAHVREIEQQSERAAIFERLAGNPTFRLPAPAAGPFRRFEPVPVTGKPASEFLIEDRRQSSRQQ